MEKDQPITLTRDELKAVIEEALKAAFVRLGIDAEDPLETQKDFQHLREWRVAMQSVRTKGVLTLVGIIISGGLAALWVGFKTAVTGQ